MAMAVGRHWAYYVMSLTITLVLALAANTSFGGLPVLASLLATGQLPAAPVRAARRPAGVRLRDLDPDHPVRALLVAVGGNTLDADPAVRDRGVHRLHAVTERTGRALAADPPAGWRYRASLNGLGAAATGVATAVFLLTKFTEGAWVVVVAVPAFITVFVRIHHYYDGTRRALGLGEIPGKPEAKPAVVVVPVTGVSRLTEYGISQALSISRHVRGRHRRATSGRGRSPGGRASCNGGGRAGTRACRCGCCGPNTPRSQDRSWPSSTGSAGSETSGSSC